MTEIIKPLEEQGRQKKHIKWLPNREEKFKSGSPLARKASRSFWRMLIIRSAIAFNSMVHSLYKSLQAILISFVFIHLAVEKCYFPSKMEGKIKNSSATSVIWVHTFFQ